jgi:hypothetical protein
MSKRDFLAALISSDLGRKIPAIYNLLCSIIDGADDSEY